MAITDYRIQLHELNALYANWYTQYETLSMKGEPVQWTDTVDECILWFQIFESIQKDKLLNLRQAKK